MQRHLYLWITDTHLLPWQRYKMLGAIHDQKPSGVFITGDISNSAQTLLGDLEFLGKRIGRPIYFTIGNHDLHGSSIEKTYAGIRELVAKYNNLVWMDKSDIIPLNEETCCIGHMGWYNGTGNKKYLKFTLDWFLTEDFRKLHSWEERFAKFEQLAQESIDSLLPKLETALDTYKVVYLLTHYPPWPEANRCNYFLSEEFYSPYNSNVMLGKALEKLMAEHKKRRLIVLAGHTHSPCVIQVSRNVECRVGKGSYYKLSDDEIIYI